MFDRLSTAQLTVNLAKCEFARAIVTYLGKIVGSGVVRSIQAKILAIQQYSSPATKRDLGLVGFYHCFCRNFSSVVAPLTALLGDGAKYVWTSDCQRAFENVKSILCSAPVLAAPRFDKSFLLQVDASNIGAGTVLIQADQGVFHPVCFFYERFCSYQLHYSVVEKEVLALIWALQHFAAYINSGVSLTVFTDHNPLTFLNSLKCPNQRLACWSLF